MRAAYLIRDSAQLTPALLAYDALVCNAAFKRATLVPHVKPGAILLASFNPTMLAKAGPTNPFYIAMRAAMDPYILRDTAGNPVKSVEYDEPYFDWRNLVGAETFAQFAQTNSDLDIYIDDCTAALPEHKWRDLPDRSVGDYFPAWRDRYIERLIELNPARIIVLNSGAWVTRQANGVCIESGHVALLGDHISLTAYYVQGRVGRLPVVNLDWSGNWEEPARGIYRGVFI